MKQGMNIMPLETTPIFAKSTTALTILTMNITNMEAARTSETNYQHGVDENC
jgi:hypothetical protein